METLREEIHYCTSCGAANKKSTVFCEECKKKIIVRHRPVADFLKKRAKGKAAGKVTEKLFDLIKDFLFKHLYGMVLTVSVVATVTTAAVTATPYIKKVTKNPVMEVKAEQAEGREEYIPTESDLYYTVYLSMNYDAILDNTLRVDGYWGMPERITSAEDMFAENNIAGYTHSGRHDMYENPLTVGNIALLDSMYNSERVFYTYRDVDEQSTVSGKNVKSELGKKLYSEGYEVMEFDYYMLTYENLPEYDYSSPPPQGITPYEMLKYRFLIVKWEDEWHIAEDILAERIGL